MPSTFTRRSLLSAGALAAALGGSGCLSALDGNGVGSQDAGTTLTLELYREDGPLREQFLVDLGETRPEWDEEAFAAALNGTDYTTQYRTPFGAREGRPEYVRHEGTYYRLGSVVVDEVATERPVLRLYGRGPVEDWDGGEVVDHAALQQIDQRAVHIAHMAARARDNEGGVPWGLVQRDGSVYRSEDASQRSDILGDDPPARVSYRNTVYEVDVTRETFYEPVYRPTADPVAESPEAMEAVVRAQFVDARFDRADLSSDERELLREAESDQGYSEPHPFSTAYESLLKRLDRYAFLDGDIENDAYDGPDGPRYLLYDGTYYQYRLSLFDSED